MTDFLAYIFITALLLVSLFLVGFMVACHRGRSHDAYDPSPQSRVTPLGVYTPRTVHKNVTRADIREGMEMARNRSYVPYIEEAQTVKVRAEHDRS